MNLRRTDMYGHAIWPLGETGYGVSVTFCGRPGEPLVPEFTFFHASDGFQQSLFSVTMMQLFDKKGPLICNVFRERVADVERLQGVRG
jgi:hypothetical protein